MQEVQYIGVIRLFTPLFLVLYYKAPGNELSLRRSKLVSKGDT